MNLNWDSFLPNRGSHCPEALALSPDRFSGLLQAGCIQGPEAPFPSSSSSFWRLCNFERLHQILLKFPANHQTLSRITGHRPQALPA